MTATLELTEEDVMIAIAAWAAAGINDVVVTTADVTLNYSTDKGVTAKVTVNKVQSKYSANGNYCGVCQVHDHWCVHIQPPPEEGR